MGASASPLVAPTGRAQGPREACPKPTASFLQVGVMEVGMIPERPERDEGCRGEALGCPGPAVTSHQGQLPPRQSRRSPTGGAAHSLRTFCLSSFWLSVSSKGASSSIMSPQRSFPGIIRHGCLPLCTVLTTTYNREPLQERKRAFGGRPATALRHFRDTNRRAGGIILDTLSLNSTLMTQSLSQ